MAAFVVVMRSEDGSETHVIGSRTGSVLDSMEAASVATEVSENNAGATVDVLQIEDYPGAGEIGTTVVEELQTVASQHADNTHPDGQPFTINYDPNDADAERWWVETRMLPPGSTPMAADMETAVSLAVDRIRQG